MRILLFTVLLAMAFGRVHARALPKDSVFLFSYFKDNGEDGLHYAYSKDGLKWMVLKHDSSILRPVVGNDKLMRDPCIIRGGDGRFHMVWTVSWKERSIGYASSDDLIHWSDQQAIPVMEHEKDALNCWAPEIFYDQPSGLYMIYWATTIPGRFKKGSENGDGKYNHRIYYVTSRDLKTFSKAAILYDGGFNVIDATIQKEGNRYLLFLKNETLKPVAEKNIRIAISDHLTNSYSEAAAPITGNYWAEGPTAIKVGNEWIVYFDKYMLHTYGAVVSNDLKNWKDVSDQLHFPEGARHGTVLRISNAELQKIMDQSK